MLAEDLAKALMKHPNAKVMIFDPECCEYRGVTAGSPDLKEVLHYKSGFDGLIYDYYYDTECDAGKNKELQESVKVIELLFEP